jgi:hypothetical protein
MLACLFVEYDECTIRFPKKGGSVKSCCQLAFGQQAFRFLVPGSNVVIVTGVIGPQQLLEVLCFAGGLLAPRMCELLCVVIDDESFE